jgi:predicted nucleic acid-binding protein
MKKLLIDTNIVIDIVIAREPFLIDSEKVFEVIDNIEVKGFLTSNTITDIYFVVKKSEGHKKTIEILKEMLNFLEIIAVDKEIILNSLESGITDFEDAIQYFSALENEIDFIITRNKKDFKNSKIPLLTPKEYCDIFA